MNYSIKSKMNLIRKNEPLLCARLSVSLIVLAISRNKYIFDFIGQLIFNKPPAGLRPFQMNIVHLMWCLPGFDLQLNV